jgi:DNA-binding NarL/FixJ family response regulator
MSINSYMDGHKASIHVLLIDEMFITQECLALVLQNSDEALTVSVVSRSNETTTQQPSPDVILFNGKSRNLDDQDMIREVSYINETWPIVPRLVILERHLPASTALEALRMGWHGYFPANERLELLIMAIRILMIGGIFVPSELRQYLLSDK